MRGGKLTLQKTTNAFPSKLLNHAHEWNNELIKGDGGVIGISENPNVLSTSMVAGPELARMVKEFEYPEQKMDNSDHTLTPHQEQSTASQVRFTSHVQSLVFTMKEPGNPFKEENTDLISLVSKDS